MVSFSCEACGDVFTKKKLDAHRNQCRGASFTCLDCMVHFKGTDYRSHTSCISEDRKYQGALYKEKPTKSKAKSVKITTPPKSEPPRTAYVEDAPDQDEKAKTALAIVDAPPAAPSPPLVSHAVNVFDYQVFDETPNASRASLLNSGEPMSMVKNAPPVFEAGNEVARIDKYDNSEGYDRAYEENGYSYGSEPIKALQNGNTKSQKYMTPVPKHALIRIRHKSKGHEKPGAGQLSSEKKRKRHHLDDLDLSRAKSQDRDEIMADAPPILHSGLTGDLKRLLQSPTPYGTNNRRGPDLSSPSKRSKNNHHSANGTKKPAISSLALVRTRQYSSEEARPHKKHHSHHHHRGDKTKPSNSTQKLKAIEYPGHDKKPVKDSQQMVLYRNKAELFMSFVTKGPDSQRGTSINKALKRYHRERNTQDQKLGKNEEEKELWRTLRLKRNDRGEVVVFF